MLGRLIVRIGQVDFYHYDVGGRSANTARFTAGVRFQFGMRPGSAERRNP